MTVSELKYLIAADGLEQSGNTVRLSVIARKLGVSKVSVYHGIERLEQSGYITHDDKKIKLTEKGRSTLEEYMLIVSFISNHLTCHCGTPEDTAYSDALGVSCAFSERSRKGVAEFLAHAGGLHG